MQKQFWFGFVAAGMLMSGVALAQTQPAPQLFGKKPVQQQAGRFDLQPQQDAKPGPVIFGRQTTVPANTPRTGTQTNLPVWGRDSRDRNRPVYQRDRDRHNHNWVASRNRNTPPGWNKGKKKGWGNCDVPPGQAKKIGCTPGRSWRDRDHDHKRDRDHDRRSGHGDGKGRK